MFIIKSLAFLKRNFLINISYRLSFFLDIISIFASITIFFFIAKIVGKEGSTYLQIWGGDYFSFVLLGLAFSGYLEVGLNSFHNTILLEQMEGTLEFILLSPTKLFSILCYEGIWNFLFISLRILIYIIIGNIVFNFDISNINIISFFVTIIATILSFSSLGLLSGSCLLIFKRADPLNWALSGVSKLLGGVYFPIIILPLWLQKLSLFIPLTYALSAIRKSIILGVPLYGISKEIGILFIFFLVFFPLGLFSFKLALNRAKRNGSLLYH